MIYFGGNTGLAQFAPGRVIPKITKSPVPLVLTEIRINSVVQHPAEGETLTRTLNDTERIVLNHKQRNIDIGYEAVTFLSPENVRYAYRLYGGDIDEEWNYVENRRSANYAHLPAGHYTFELKAQNPDGFWNEEPRRLEIVIKPSPLLTWYAFLLYIAAAGGAAWFANRLYLRRRLQKMELQLAPHGTGARKGADQHEDQLLHQYFPRAAHAALADLRSGEHAAGHHRRKTVARAGQPDQLQHPAAAQADRPDIEPEPHRERHPAAVGLPAGHHSLRRRLTDGFACLAREKQIRACGRRATRKDGWVRRPWMSDKFSKVLSNLVSNALKYTPEGGHVDVALTLTETLPEKLAGAAPASRYLVVSVTDDGIGMSQEDVGRISNATNA